MVPDQVLAEVRTAVDALPHDLSRDSMRSMLQLLQEMQQLPDTTTAPQFRAHALRIAALSCAAVAALDSEEALMWRALRLPGAA